MNDITTILCISNIVLVIFSLFLLYTIYKQQKLIDTYKEYFDDLNDTCNGYYIKNKNGFK